jgi:hypothetical protein
MDKGYFVLVHNAARSNAMQAVQNAPSGHVVMISEPSRTLEQNAAQWPILAEFARQKQWPVNGELCWITKEEWKDVLTAAFKKEQVRLAAGIDGGVVMLGRRTSKFGKQEFSEWLGYLHYCAARFEVKLNYE